MPSSLFRVDAGTSAVPYLSRQRMKLPPCPSEERPGWAGRRGVGAVNTHTYTHAGLKETGKHSKVREVQLYKARPVGMKK